MKSYDETYNMTGINYYSYEDLFNAFVKQPSQENVNRLAYWFEHYEHSGWNGEKWSWTAANGYEYSLIPVHSETEDGDFIVTDWEIR